MDERWLPAASPSPRALASPSRGLRRRGASPDFRKYLRYNAHVQRRPMHTWVTATRQRPLDRGLSGRSATLRLGSGEGKRTSAEGRGEGTRGGGWRGSAVPRVLGRHQGDGGATAPRSQQLRSPLVQSSLHLALATRQRGVRLKRTQGRHGHRGRGCGGAADPFASPVGSAGAGQAGGLTANGHGRVRPEDWTGRFLGGRRPHSLRVGGGGGVHGGWRGHTHTEELGRDCARAWRSTHIHRHAGRCTHTRHNTCNIENIPGASRSTVYSGSNETPTGSRKISWRVVHWASVRRCRAASIIS